MQKALGFVLALCLATCGAASAQQAAQSPAAAQADALFDEYWEWTLLESPEFATYVGDRRYQDRLRDESAAAVARRKAFYAEFRSRLAGIDAQQLPVLTRTSLQVLRYRFDMFAALNKQYGTHPFGVNDTWAPVTQMGGIHLALPQLASVSRFETVGDYEAYLKRLGAVPTSIAHLIARMETAMAAGWMPAKAAIRNVPKQLEAQLPDDATQSPEYNPFKSFPADIAAAEQRRLADAGREVIRDKVIPAFRSLKAFYEERYLPAARDSLAASSLPPGMPFYQALLDWNTTTDLSPRQIHELGLREVARIGAQMDGSVAAAGFTGTRAEFQKAISTDPRFFYTRPEDMLAGYRDIAKRADAELPKFFAVLPRQTYGIRAMRPEEGNNAEHYTPGAGDGSRAGYFEANVNDLTTRPKWNMETLLLHETVPGHHLQIATAVHERALDLHVDQCSLAVIQDTRYKYVHYVGYPPQLFDLIADPEETRDLAADRTHADARAMCERELRAICDPEAVDRRARADQRRRLEAAGGADAVLGAGVKIPYTPAPAEFAPAPVEARERGQRSARLDATPGLG
jgi:uncharacterized protein (DUF885 family)